MTSHYLNGCRVEIGAAGHDEHMLDELELFIDNDGALYESRSLPIYKNLERKWKRGVFDQTKAAKGFSYLIDDGAKKFHRDFRYGGKWYQTFPKSLRDELSKRYAQNMAEELRAGNSWLDD